MNLCPVRVICSAHRIFLHFITPECGEGFKSRSCSLQSSPLSSYLIPVGPDIFFSILSFQPTLFHKRGPNRPSFTPIRATRQTYVYVYSIFTFLGGILESKKLRADLYSSLDMSFKVLLNSLRVQLLISYCRSKS